MSFDLQGVNPFYEDSKLKLRFFSNLNDGPDAYDVFLGELGEHHFYLPSRVLPELSNPQMNAREVVGTLERLNPTIPTLLQEHQISGKEIQNSFRQVFLRQGERYRAWVRETAFEHHQS